MSRIPEKVEFDITIREMADKHQDDWHDPLSAQKRPIEWVVTSEKKYNSIDATQVLQELLHNLHSHI